MHTTTTSVPSYPCSTHRPLTCVSARARCLFHFSAITKNKNLIVIGFSVFLSIESGIPILCQVLHLSRLSTLPQTVRISSPTAFSSHPKTRPFSVECSLSLTHTHALSHTHTHTHALSLSLSLSHRHTHTHTHSLSLSQTHTHKGINTVR